MNPGVKTLIFSYIIYENQFLQTKRNEILITYIN